VDIIIHKYKLPQDYEPEVLKEAQNLFIDWGKELKRRKDLRDQVCFTIDPPKARDFDDAVAIEKNARGKLPPLGAYSGRVLLCEGGLRP
jgi:ribonuclease R